MNECMHLCSPAALHHHDPSVHTHPAKQPFCAKAWLLHRPSRGAHFIPQLFHPTWRHSYNATYYSLMHPNIDVCVYTATGQREDRNWEWDGSICSLVIMREASDNILVLNWYRLTKYPDQEERAAVLSCLFTVSAPTAPSCTVTIWSILIQTSSPLGLSPNLIFNTVCSSHPVGVYLSFHFSCKDWCVIFLWWNNTTLMEDYWFHTGKYKEHEGVML